MKIMAVILIIIALMPGTEFEIKTSVGSYSYSSQRFYKRHIDFFKKVFNR